MDAMVTARVPVEIKKQVDEILKSMGSSATELVNAAYDYVLKNKALPVMETQPPAKVQRKILRGEEAKRFREVVAKRTVRLPDNTEYDGTNFKELLNKYRDEKYARTNG